MNYGVRYHYYTELYDRSISDFRSPYTGNAMPITSWGFFLMNQNARRVLREIEKEASRDGVTGQDLQRQIHKAARYSFEELERLMEYERVSR